MKPILASLFLALASCVALANCPAGNLKLTTVSNSGKALFACVPVAALYDVRYLDDRFLSEDGKTKPKPTPKESKPAPATVEFTPDQAERLSKSYSKTRIAILEAQNLQLQLEAEQARLVKLQEDAQMVQTAYLELLAALSEMHGVKKEELGNYLLVTPDTKFGLKRNPKAPAAPEGKPEAEAKAVAKKDGEQ